MRRLYPKIPVYSDWVLFSVTITNGGTTSSNLGFWRRSGDSIDLQYLTTWTGSGAGANLTFSIPAAMVIDGPTKTGNVASRSIIGYGSFYDSSVPQNNSCAVNDLTTTTLCLMNHGGTGILQGSALGNADVTSFFVSAVPIVGFSSNRRGR